MTAQHHPLDGNLNLSHGLRQWADTATTGILYTSSRAFPRSRKNPGPLIQAIHAWMLNGPPEAPLTEDWLLNPASR